MADKRLPFLTKAFACPACGKMADHRQFRSRAFGPGEMESDNHVLTYVWHDPQFVQVHPPLYFTYFCPDCYFTAPAENFLDPETILHRRVGIKAFQTARDADDKVLTLLGQRIDYNSITFESALWMHLLAIYVQLLREAEYRDHYLIGRLFLRVAWLYREESAARPEGDAPADAGSGDESPERRVSEALREFDALLHQCNEARDKVAEAIKADAGQRIAKDAGAFFKTLSRAERLLEALHSESYRLKSAVNKSFIADPPGGDRSYSLDFLDQLKEEWVYAPADEEEAMRSAIEQLEKAIASDGRLSGPDAFFRTSALIVDLELRCNDLDAAFKKVRGIVDSIMKDRDAINKRVAQETDPSRKNDLLRIQSAAAKALERASDLRFQVVDQVIEREMPKISKILREHSKSTPGQKKVALLSSGISHGIIHQLEEKKFL